MRHCASMWLVLGLLVPWWWGPGASAEPVLKTQAWENNDAGFDDFSQRVVSCTARNLLARPGVRVFVESESFSRAADLLTDGEAGTRGDQGRCFVAGHPTAITYYLGGPKTIQEIGVLSFNVDTRSNQDYEVRWANNSAQPGAMPAFPDKPDLSTGDQVIGADRGGFHSRFFDSGGKALGPGKVDWVQFRIWATHTAKAGAPARIAEGRGAAVVVELEVLGEEHDVLAPSKEELEFRQAMREPPYVKQATWQETLIAGREAIVEWEKLHDRLAKLNASRRGVGPSSPQTARQIQSARIARRAQVAARVRRDFSDPVDQRQIGWELADGIWTSEFGRQRQIDDWRPGKVESFLQNKYQQAIQRRLNDIRAELAEPAGVKGRVLAARKDRIESWLAQLPAAPKPELPAAAWREAYYRLAAMQEVVALGALLESIRLAVEDQRKTFQQQYPKAESFLRQVAAEKKKVEIAWDGLLAGGPAAIEACLELAGQIDRLQAEILLDTPLLAFDKLLLVKGRPGFASNWGGPNRLGDEMVVLSPVRPDGQLTTLHKGTVSDMDLHWDARRILFSDGNALWEINVDGSDLRRVSREDPPVTHYDGCYLPDGRIVCASNACEQAVPCTGGPNVGNLHLLNAAGSGERRVTYDQDHDWNPVVLNAGRVLFTRWEYADLPHYFSRLLFRMNPDGTGQMEYYGSNSYWPNAMYWPRPIPGHPTMVVCVVSGHHGVSRVGELLLLDPARGRHEAAGAVQRIPGYGKPVPPIIRDNLVGESWPKFASPWPLAEPGTNRGAGRYFLASVQRDSLSSWDLCLVDVFDNITPILAGGYVTPIPLRPRPMPPVVPSQLDPQAGDAVVYLADVYRGDGLRGYPRGSIKALRVGVHHYRFAGNGDTRASSFEGGWDVKRILGTVPVCEDGSAMFRVPANTPIFVQPLDAEGKAQQQMRSWYTAMPGEIASCVGCHERQNTGPPSRAVLAAKCAPDEIAPWNGPVRGFSFDREVQPVLDRRCVGCHDGRPQQVGGQPMATIDLRAKQLRPDYKDNYSPAYMELQRYVRRAGYESDNHMHAPAEFEADTSPLVQMLKKGHYNVRLLSEEWERLYAWIDFNVPYAANWRESHRPPKDEQVERRVLYKKLFSGIDDHDEDPLPLPLPPVAPFEPPAAVSAQLSPAVTVESWPMAAEQAQALQKAAGPAELDLDLGDGVQMKLILVPAGRFVMGDPQGFADEQAQAVVTITRPYYLGRLEVTNRQYAQFDSTHDSGYVEGRGKDRTSRGTPINAPDQPVVRVSWNEALAFCEWLSQKTGRRCTLPTEAQWEWACRAGTATRFSFGSYEPGQKNLANVADASIEKWNYGRSEPGYQDGVPYTAPGGRFPANAWGLSDMHGNVAEWCLSTYRPYPYRPADGRDDPRTPGLKVVRGGSWNDTFRGATSASRWRYQPYQPIYNVGFRVLCEATRGSVGT